MKLAFSTLGCPMWTWDEIVSTAKDLGIEGIEVRGIYNTINAYDAPPFAPENVKATMARLEKLGLQICIFSTSAILSDKKNINRHIDEVKEYLRLCSDTGVKYIRVLGDRSPAPEEEIDEAFVEYQISYLCEFAEKYGVTLLVETNGVYADTAKLAAMIGRINSPAAGILWDIHHPYRYMHETMETSYANVKKYLRHVHVKDSIVIGGITVYKMPGYGDLPLAACVKLLSDAKYDGFISLEWVKRWNDELEDPGIVFTNYVNFMRSLQK
jgi:sugar phosphate isomerase/epimerase